MLFNSLTFLIFFVITFVIYYLVCEKYRYLVLLIASYIFYGYSNINYIAVLLGITIISYTSGIIINNIKEKKNKQIIIALSTILSLIILLYFKYFEFITQSINDIFSANISLSKIVIPLGISFFILQSISYPIDLYRKKVDVEENFFRYALFVSFFPQILSGPIGKSREMIPQFRQNHKFNSKSVFFGLIIVLYGYFQKLVIADLIAIGINNVYGNLPHYTGIPLLIVVLLYSFQIYFDFSSYSNIAKGIAKMLGYDLPNNFNSPYFANSIKNFWSRWHISLSSWFKEYLYIPLGGNRKGTIRTYINIIIVFLVSGLWHGANYTYIIWGLLHGLYQVIERIINKNNKNNILNILITFLLVTFAWIFFRANTLSDAFYVIKNMFNISFDNIKEQILSVGLDKYDLIVSFVSIIFTFVIEIISRKKKLLPMLYEKPIYLKSAMVLILVFLILVFGCYGPGFDNNQFIYLGY